MFGDLWRFEPSAFGQMDWMRQMMDEMFRDFGVADIRSVPRGTFPLVNIGATADAVNVYVFAPGVAPDDLDVSIQDNVLFLRGKRVAKAAQGEGGETRPVYRQERFQGEFTRAVALPENLDTEQTEAQFRDGVVQIRLPKRQELQPRRIEINAV